ncbi:MAG TPA: radical SAM protein [Polyangia bacterium]
MSTTLVVNEIYLSLQGESTFAGLPCVFIRLTACDLRCSYCDTEYAFTGGQEVSVESIVADVEARGVPLVLLTGGEPLLQRELPALCAALLDKKFEVMIETGGHRDTSALPAGVVVILDVKTPGSGEAAKMCWANLERLGPRDAVKFVVTDERDYEWARTLIREKRLDARCHVLVSPAFGQVEPKNLVAWMLRDKLPARLNLQIHKYVWPPDERGV